GEANSTTVNAFGGQYVSSGGVANSTTVNAGGHQTVYSGGVANDARIFNFASQYVSSGGVANSTTINSGGTQSVHSGGSSLDVVQSAGGNVFVEVIGGDNGTKISGTNASGVFSYSGGVASNFILYAGGYQNISSGGVANAATVNSGGDQYVYAGGEANSTTVNAFGGQYVSSGGVANAATVNSGGTQSVYAGGAANDTTVGNGGSQWVSGGVASGTTVSSGGRQIVSSGGMLAGSNFIAEGGALEAAEVVFRDEATVLRIESDSDTVQAAAFRGAGTLIKEGTGTLTLAGANVYTGGTVISAGTLEITGSLGTAAGGHAGGITNDGSLVFNQTGGQILSGDIAGGGDLSKTGSGTLVLTGAVSQKNITLEAGRLDIGQGGVAAYGLFTAEDNTTLGLTAGGGPALAAGSAAIGNSVTLDILSYDGESAHTLIRAAGGITGDFAAVKAGGADVAPPDPAATPDVFMSVTVDKVAGGTELEVKQGLIWERSRDAHGTFNVATAFTLNTDLADNTGGAWAYGWDGTTLTKTGAGTLTLAGENAYTGGTVVREGTLEVTGSLGNGDHDGDIAADGSLVFNQAGDQTLRGDIAGAGGLTKTGAGTLTLTGKNTYAGGTTVRGGALGIASDGNIGTGANTLDGGVLLLTGSGYAKDWTLGAGTNAVDTGGGVNFSGVFSGAGGLTKTGAGTLTLTNGNTYAGNTAVSAGTLEVTGSLGGGDYAGDIAVDGSLIFNQAGDQRLSGDIAGAGGLTKTGAGTLTLAGANAYTGGTTVEAGVLAGDTAGLQGDIDVAAGAFLRFAQGFDGVLNGRLGGAGALEKDGAGKLVLNGGHSAGAVDVSGGSLIVGGSRSESAARLDAGGDVNVHDGALLGGHGTIAANEVIVRPGGILSPGNSYGTTTVNGDHTFMPGSYFDVEVNPNDTNEGDKLIVTGTATLAGTFRHISTGGAPGDYAAPGKKWLILDAGALVGRFDEAISDLAFLSPLLDYDYTNADLYLSFVRSSSFADFAASGNQGAVAGALESLDHNGGLYRELLGGVTTARARRVLNELSGEAHATLKSNLFMLDNAFARRLARRASGRSALRGARPDAARPFAGNNLWVSVDQAYGSLYGDEGAARSSLHGTELSGGYDADFAGGWLGGLAFRFNAGHQDVDSRRSEADIKSYGAALYGGREFPLGPGVLRFLLSGAFTLHEVESERKIGIGSRDQTVEASYGGRSFLGSFETAYRVSPAGMFSLEPYASIGWHSLRLDGFAESGGNAALRGNEEDWNHAVSVLGLRLSTPLPGRFSIDADLGWRHVYGGIRPESSFAFREGSDRFSVKGAAMNRDAAVLGLGLGLKLTDNVSVGLRYDGETGARGQSHGGRAVFEVTW
ncbi:MAG: autotransporter domain-containing protein, partial [Desulfovibrio sp.]|nr:autotransporter domain-containing protein [Desulfovibrio sp.]